MYAETRYFFIFQNISGATNFFKNCGYPFLSYTIQAILFINKKSGTFECLFGLHWLYFIKNLISETHSSLHFLYLLFLAAGDLKMPIPFVLQEVPQQTIAQFIHGILFRRHVVLKSFCIVLSVHCYYHVTTIKFDQNIRREIPMFPNQGLLRVTML